MTSLVPPPPVRDDGATPDRSSRWRTVLGIGCATVLLLAIAAAVVVQQNWPRLTALYHGASAATTAMYRLITTLQAKYGGAVAVNIKQLSGVEGSILSIGLTNSPFLEQFDPDTPAGKAKALEIAATARDALPPEFEYQHYEVLLSRASGAGVTVSKAWVFRFEPSDLPARAAR